MTALFQSSGKAIATGALLVALVALTAACGSSGGDSTQVVNGGATVSPESPPDPTVPAGKSQATARQELDNLIQLAQGELTLDRQELTAYSEQVGAVLKRIDSDPDVLEAFKNLLEDMLGVTFVLEGAARFNEEPLGKVGRALPVFAPQQSFTGPFKCSAADPEYDLYAGSIAWLYLRCFMDALFDVNVPASEALAAANPLFATEIPKLFVRSQVTNRCINDIERCVRGDDPVFNKFQQGDFVGAHKTIRGLTTTPEPTRVPAQAPTLAPTAVQAQTPSPTVFLFPTASPLPAATLPPTIALEPTAVPTPESALSDFSGTWVGRYSGLYTHGFSICGSTIPIEGSITAVLTQTGTQVTGTATLGGVDILEIVQDADGNCSIVKAADEVTMIFASVAGDILSSAPGFPVTFTMTKSSGNSAQGTTTLRTVARANSLLRRLSQDTAAIRKLSTKRICA